MNYYKILFILLFLFFPICLQAQTSSSTNLEETGIWNGFYFKGKFTNKIGYHGEHHLRLRNNINNLNSFFGRTKAIYNRAGINIFFNDYFEAVIGPTLVLNITPDAENENFERIVIEPRIWHQWLFIMPKMGRLKVYHQFRFEHRWRRTNVVGSEYNYTNRYRYKISGYLPINKKKITTKTLFFSPSAEIFMHTGKSIVYHPLEDFRIYNGLGYVLNKNITLFSGHMWTIGQKNTGFEYRTSHILRFNIFVGMDFRKIENKIPQINIGY